jgi:hypothetical protein
MRQPVIAPPGVEIIYQPSADGFMTDWLEARGQRALEMTIGAAPSCGVEIERIYVYGVEFYDEPTRWIVVSPHVHGTHDQSFAYWGVLADTVARPNTPPPTCAANADVTIQVSVWDA